MTRRQRVDARLTPTPAQAIALAKRFEGFHRVLKNDPERRAHPYLCPAGYMTIGYGHLIADLHIALDATLRYCPVLATEPQERLAAIVDFTFNLGVGRLQTSTLRRRINQQDWLSAPRELRRWVYGGGRVLPGLVARREAEVLLLLSG